VKVILGSTLTKHLSLFLRLGKSIEQLGFEKTSEYCYAKVIGDDDNVAINDCFNYWKKCKLSLSSKFDSTIILSAPWGKEIPHSQKKTTIFKLHSLFLLNDANSPQFALGL
jgi:hypothetical protein